MFDDDSLDSQIRLAAFKRLQTLSKNRPYIPLGEINLGFTFGNENIRFTHTQQGIYKPRQMETLLSVRTLLAKKGKKVWYADQLTAHNQVFEGYDSVDYAFMGTDPQRGQNQHMRIAYERQLPIIYFLEVAPQRYLAHMPTFIIDWDPKSLKVRLAFGLPLQQGLADIEDYKSALIGSFPNQFNDRRYALRTVQQRLHQASFREALIHAYDGRCAISGIPEPKLLDAAHIVPDANEEFGQPIVANGLPLSKIHYAAFDANLIGIDPEYRIHVSDQLLNNQDGPLLEALKLVDGKYLKLPKREEHKPDPVRPKLRYNQFQESL